MKAFFSFTAVLILSLCFIPQAKGQDLSKYHTSRTQAAGTLYFIFPFNEFESVADKSELSFDITCLQGRDSTTINFTCFTSDPFPVDSLWIQCGSAYFSGKAKRIYVDFKKNNWENRYSVRLPFNDLVRIFKCETVPVTGVRSGETILEYTVKEKKWSTYAGAVDKILYLISLE